MEKINQERLQREARLTRIEKKVVKCCNTCDFFSGNKEDGIGIRPAWCCNETSPLYNQEVDECEVHDCHTNNMDELLDDGDLDWYENLLDFARDLESDE